MQKLGEYTKTRGVCKDQRAIQKLEDNTKKPQEYAKPKYYTKPKDYEKPED